MKIFPLPAFAVAFAFIGGAGLQATTMPAHPVVNYASPVGSEFQPVQFSTSAEAGMLHRAYRILAKGDHDYRGRRLRAMHQVKTAAELLGLDLRGDDRDREKQLLSDDRLREAAGLMSQALASSGVAGQKKVVHHLNAALKEINAALKIR